MAIGDTLKGLSKKARDEAAGHKDELKKAVEKAEAMADKQTKGKYHDKIEQAGAKADQYIDGLPAPEGGSEPTKEAGPDKAA
ncbi:MAG: antitoxin [Actinobacteria bacterium]|nr:antitoxin [Actinomycetota bacterium]